MAKTQGSLDDAHNSALTQMLASKRKVEAAGDRPPLEDLMTLLFSSTQVRGCPYRKVRGHWRRKVRGHPCRKVRGRPCRTHRGLGPGTRRK